MTNRSIQPASKPWESRTPAAVGFRAVTVLLLACSAADREAPNIGEFRIAKPANSGDAQVGVAGVRLPDSLRVVVTRNDKPAAGVTVVWFTTEGSVNPATVRTGPDGMAATTWTPLLLFAEQFMTARVDGDGGAAVGFTAIATPDPDAPNTILVLGAGAGRFEPAELTVPVGGSVNWFWPPGSVGHNIVPDDGDSPPQSGAPADWPKWHVFQFTAPGVYHYHCSVHGGPGGVGMSGTVTVKPVIPE